MKNLPFFWHVNEELAINQVMSDETIKISNKKSAFDPIKNEDMLFFFITPLGLEDIVQADVINILTTNQRPFKLIESTKGGFEIEMCFVQLIDLIPYMKGLTRILMRLGNTANPKLYKTIVRDYPKLFQKISKYPWENFLFGDLPKIEVSTSNSRIFDSRKIEKAIHEGIERHYQMKPVKAVYLAKKESHSPNTLFVRVINDELTMSIDLVGDRLDQRHEKLLTSKAPLRESIANALAKKSFSIIPKNCYPLTLIDPFVGSGTMIKESLELHTPTMKRIINEDYAFFNFPVFDKWKKSLDFKEFKPRFDYYKNLTIKNNVIKDIKAFDLDPVMLKTAKTNLENAIKNFNTPITFEIQDATEFSFKNENNTTTFIFTNPPYGERIELKNAKGESISSDNFLTMIISRFHHEKINYVGFVSTPEQTKTIKKSPNHEILYRKTFKNGGLDVEFILLENKF